MMGRKDLGAFGEGERLDRGIFSASFVTPIVLFGSVDPSSPSCVWN